MNTEDMSLQTHEEVRTLKMNGGVWHYTRPSERSAHVLVPPQTSKCFHSEFADSTLQQLSEA